MINNKLDSMRLKFHFSNSFGTLEGTLIPWDSIMYSSALSDGSIFI